MPTKSLYQRVKESKPRWYPGMVLKPEDVREIERMLKRIRGLEGAVRDLTEK